MELRDRVVWEIRRLFYQLKHTVLRWKLGDRWEEQGEFRQRAYPDYETYVEHQKTKFSALRSKSVIGHDERFHRNLSARLAAMPLDFHGRAVLCLAARQGSEVKAFIDQGAFAVGIDLNPGPKNRFVVVGDFHDLQFADGSVDVVYTNSLDHAFDVDRILAEVVRVLAPDGVFIMEANVSADDGAAPAGPYEAMVWEDARALVAKIEAHGFRTEAQQSIEEPWIGEQYTFRRVGSPAAEGAADGR